MSDITHATIRALRKLSEMMTPGERIEAWRLVQQDYCRRCGDKHDDCQCPMEK